MLGNCNRSYGFEYADLELHDICHAPDPKLLGDLFEFITLR